MYPALQAQSVTTALELGDVDMTGQFVHAALPLTGLYVPTSHDEHTPPFGPVNPALQAQAATAELVVGDMVLTGHVTQVAAAVAAVVVEYVPTPQLLHAALPVAILYVPGGHAEHGPPSGPVYPALQDTPTQGPPAGPEDPTLQVQSVTASLKLGDILLLGQFKQADTLVAPSVPEYFPAAQFVHGAVPREEYCPG